MASRETPREQALALVATQRMPGMDQRYAEQVSKAYADIAGIGVMAVDEIRRPGLSAQPGDDVVGKAVEMVPQLLFRNVFLRAGLDTDDPCLVGQWLLGQRVVFTDVRIDDPPRDEVDALDVTAPRERAREVDDIFGLSAGIGIAAQFEFVTADQAVNADEQQVFAVDGLGHGIHCPAFSCSARLAGIARD